MRAIGFRESSSLSLALLFLRLADEDEPDENGLFPSTMSSNRWNEEEEEEDGDEGAEEGEGGEGGGLESSKSNWRWEIFCLSSSWKSESEEDGSSRPSATRDNRASKCLISD